MHGEDVGPTSGSIYENWISSKMPNSDSCFLWSCYFSKDLMNYYVEYFHIDKQNELVEYYNKTIVPLQNELNKEKENFDNRVNNLV